MRNGVANNENSTQKQEERRPIKENKWKESIQIDQESPFQKSAFHRNCLDDILGLRNVLLHLQLGDDGAVVVVVAAAAAGDVVGEQPDDVGGGIGDDVVVVGGGVGGDGFAAAVGLD